MSDTPNLDYQASGAAAKVFAAREAYDVAHSLQRPCCASGSATSEKRSIEPWVLEAARELAMDSAHIPCIAQIIQRHVPPHNAAHERPANNPKR